MRFFSVRVQETKKQWVVAPWYRVGIFDDLMIRGGKPYAIFDYETGLWSTNMYDVVRIVDAELDKKANELIEEGKAVYVSRLSAADTKMWDSFLTNSSKLPDRFEPLDRTVTFSDKTTSQKDYVSKKLSYSPKEMPTPGYDKLMHTLYSPQELEKIEWFIGAIAAGESKDIQKFLVLFGDPGSGKSTVINILISLFGGYAAPFVAEDLGIASKSFSMEPFADNPLVAYDHDAKLSKIDTNTRLNAIVSHEKMIMNEKYKSAYPMVIDAVLVVGTNTPIKITDAKSGLIRRIVDASPTGDKLPFQEYQDCVSQIGFERAGIVWKCLQLYLERGKEYYDSYRPMQMIERTDYFFNFVEENFLIFKEEDGVSLSRAFSMYKEYLEDSNMDYGLTKAAFRDELKNYFKEFYKQLRVGNENLRNYYKGFKTEKFVITQDECGNAVSWISLTEGDSLLDSLYSPCKAQYSTENGTPAVKWGSVKTILGDLDTHREHYLIPPDISHIMIDFDLKDISGEKSLELNLEAARRFPPTYCEVSKGGKGIHLHYIYDGDPDTLSPLYSEGIEIKVFRGNSSIRRRLSLCNGLGVAHISDGLPLKGEKKVVDKDRMTSEKSVRALIERALRKEIFPNTKPSMDFIKKVLDDAYSSDIYYDVRDMRQSILNFASRSTNQAPACIRMLGEMRFFKEPESPENLHEAAEEDPLVFFDCEVFPNLFLVNWKYQGKDKPVVRMINPTPKEIEALFSMKLVGFNNRRYDNHMLYARYLGYTNEELYYLSQRLVNDSRNATFGEAYNLSYTDVYDFASATHKQSLKKFEIELGIHHKELGLPWDQPVPEERWVEVAEYCDNDVIATEAVFEYLSGDWAARKILARLAGMTVNDTTNSLTGRIVFGKEKNPQREFVYTDLSTIFPGYKFEKGKSYYRGEETGEGGYVYAEPGIYYDVALLDIASMHPTSIEQLNLFGDRYTNTYSSLKRARLLIKHKAWDELRHILGGMLADDIPRMMEDKAYVKDVSNALKTALNSAYGLTSAKFPNLFKDPRNIDNIVAKRGALFMVNLKHEVQARGFTVAHIKTDSIKIPNATPEIIQFVMDYGREYGYEFEHEHTYERMCLVNDAVYIARDAEAEEHNGWTATGAQFAHPYIFKTLFAQESLTMMDHAETKAVQSAMYLDMRESDEDPENYIFVGRVGSFVPVTSNGGYLMRDQNGKMVAVTGTTGYKWMETETYSLLDAGTDGLDHRYYDALMQKAIDTIGKYGDWAEFCTTPGYPPWDAAAIPEPLPF